MTRIEYTVSSYKATEKSEKNIRKFLLNKSDSIRLTEIYWNDLGFFKIRKFGGEKDPKFIEVLNKLKPFFIKKITNSETPHSKLWGIKN